MDFYASGHLDCTKDTIEPTRRSKRKTSEITSESCSSDAKRGRTSPRRRSPVLTALAAIALPIMVIAGEIAAPPVFPSLDIAPGSPLASFSDEYRTEIMGEQELFYEGDVDILNVDESDLIKVDTSKKGWDRDLLASEICRIYGKLMWIWQFNLVLLLHLFFGIKTIQRSIDIGLDMCIEW